jgi:DNA-binding transcriptional MerR regulator
MDDFTETSSGLARAAGITAQTVRLYADLNLIECKVASNGVRLFRAGQADRVREIYQQRVGLRGRRRVG